MGDRKAPTPPPAQVDTSLGDLVPDLKLLGFEVRDRVTGLAGVVTSISFDISGCVQGLVNPGLGKDGKLGEQYWFDTKRLIVTGRKPAMAQPHFIRVPGGQNLPAFSSQPVP